MQSIVTCSTREKTKRREREKSELLPSKQWEKEKKQNTEPKAAQKEGRPKKMDEPFHKKRERDKDFPTPTHH